MLNCIVRGRSAHRQLVLRYRQYHRPIVPLPRFCCDAISGIKEADMKKSHLLTPAVFAFLAFAAANAVAQLSSAGTGVPVHVVVTVEARKGGETPVINREDVMVHVGHDRDTVIDWVPAQGEHKLLELMIMLDDGSNTTLGTQLEDLRKFINAQPDTTTIGVTYMRDGI